MKISCTWSPNWLGYLAIAKAENFEYSRLLKSKEKLPSFIEEVEAKLKEKNMDNQCSSCGGFCKKSGCERKNVEVQQRPWVGLTIEEIAACCAESTTTQFSFYNAIEAKLIEKNSA